MKKNGTCFLLFIIVLALLFTFGCRNLFSYEMFNTGDLSPFPEYAGDAYKAFLSSWQPQSLGHHESGNPFYFLIAIFTFIFNSGALAQKALYFSMAPFAGVTMYIFLSHFISSRLGKFVASFMYSVNFLNLWQYIGGGLTLVYVSALLPLSLLFLFKMLEEKENKIRNMLVFSYFLGFTFFFHPHSILMIAPFVGTFLFINLALKRNLKYTLTTLGLLLTSLVIFYFLALPYFGFLPVRNITAWGSALPVERLIENVRYTYSPCTMVYILSIGNFVFAIFAFASLLLVSERQRSKYAFGFSILAILIILFIWLTNRGLTLWLFCAYPFLFVFENPVKLWGMLLLAYSPLIALTINEIDRSAMRSKVGSLIDGRINGRQKIIGRRSTSLILCVVLIFSAAIYMLPLWPQLASGDMGLSQFRDTHFVVEPVYRTAGEWINARRLHEGFFRTLWVPFDFRSYQSLFWIDPYVFSVPPGGGRYEFNSSNYIKFTLDLLVNERTNRIGALLASANVKYVVVNLASEQKGPPRVIEADDTYYPVGDPKKFVEILNSQKDLVLVAEEKDFLVYKNTEFIPHIMAYDRVFFVMPAVHTSSTPTLYNVTGNLISNPGFEEGLTSWGRYLSEEASLDDVTYHSGSFSVKMTNERKGWVVIWQSLHVEGGQQYQISAWMKIQNAKNSHFKLVWYDRWEGVSEDQSIRQDVLGPHFDGTRDWWQVSGVVTSPDNAVRVDIMGLGGWSNDGVNQGLTWFDDVSFIEVYSPLSNPTSSLSLMTTMFYIPRFDLNHQLLVFGEQPSLSETWLLKNSNVVVLMGGVDSEEIMKNISRSQTLVYVYEAESSFIPKRGHWRHLREISASNGYIALCNGEGEATLKFFAPESGYGKIALRAMTDGNITFAINGKKVNVALNGMIDDGFKWYETDSFYLERGKHEVSIVCDGGLTALDVMVGLLAEDNVTLDKVFSSSLSFNISLSQISPTEYTVEVKSEKPLFIFLGESYHPAWNAYATQGRLQHFETFGWANGFYLNNTENSVKIIFDLQNERNLAVMIWATAWIFLIVGIIYTSRKRI